LPDRLIRSLGVSCGQRNRSTDWNPAYSLTGGVQDPVENERTGVGALKDRQVIEGRTHARVTPTDRIRGHIDDLFAQDRPLPEILEEVARLGA
jgi:hypothetical protein